MKSNLLLLSLLISFFAFSCSQPIANSLLVNSQKGACVTNCTNSDDTDLGGVSITPARKENISVPLDDGDQFEITGTCKDLGRKDNRIIVEAYSSEDEAAHPFLDLTISDKCTTTTNPVRSGLEGALINPKAAVMGTGQSTTFTAIAGTLPYSYSIISGGGVIGAGTGVFTSPGGSGTTIIQVTDGAGETSRSIVTTLAGISTTVTTPENGKCLIVTKGVGLTVDAGRPTEHAFPQCHNGQFGFSVRLGKALVNASPGQTNYKYLVRMKLQTKDGTTSSSPWEKVTIDRGLAAPTLTATNVHDAQKCVIKSSPARFNHGIFYTLNRTYTDISAVNAGSINLFANANTLVNTLGTSVAQWDDVGLVDGVTYNYTLSNTDAGSAYGVPPTLSSTVVTCRTKKIYVQQTQAPTNSACYLGLNSTDLSLDGEGDQKKTIVNPSAIYEWGYSTLDGWTGVDGKALVPPIFTGCGDNAVCSQSGLTAGTVYFFALRARNASGVIGRWSPTVACKPQ